MRPSGRTWGLLLLVPAFFTAVLLTLFSRKTGEWFCLAERLRAEHSKQAPP
jgi:hypothetical protein